MNSLLTGDHLRRAASRNPDKPAVCMDDRCLSFAEMDRQANRVAQALLRAGLKKGDVIANLSPTVLDYPGVVFGSARSGCISVNLSVRLTEADVVRMIETAGLRLIFVGPGQAAKAAAARDASGRDIRLVGLAGAEAGVDGVESLADFLDGAPETEPPVDLSPDDPYVMVLSGGTTGFPKLILHNHRATTNWMHAAALEFQLTRDDVFAVSTPLFHAAGLLIWLNSAVMLGATSHLQDGWDPAEFSRMVAAHGITAAMLVPTQLNDLIRQPDFDPARLTSLRKVNHAGMPMPVALMKRLMAVFPDIGFTDNYGASETGPMCVRPPSALPDKAHSVGRPVYTLEVAVADGEGRPLPRGETGEVMTRGDHVLMGYYGDPDASAAIRRPGGWIVTGDVGFFDEDGYLVLVDRSKDVIVAGGENIYPNEVENALYQHAAVAECAVFGIPDDHWGELPAAHVVLKPGAAATETELTDFVASQIAKHKRPRLIAFVDSLPRTAVGKIQKNLIRAPYWEGRGRAI